MITIRCLIGLVVFLSFERMPPTVSALLAQQLGEARGGAEFPRQRALAARPVERLPEVALGRRRGSGLALQQQKLALDAQQLGREPACRGMLDP
jgi:hypothetical protein